jgi:transposase InsO family protein
MEVTRSAYYQSLHRKKTKTAEKREAILQAVQEVRNTKYGDTYGSPRMYQQLLLKEVSCSLNTVADVMRNAGIQAKHKAKFRISTTDSNHALPIAPNRLKQDFNAQRINQIWLSDITYLPTLEGFTYLCAVEDLYSRKIVGWATSRAIDTELVLAAFNQAAALRNPPPGLIVHSDRGTQYASAAFRRRLDQLQCLQSMSRRGNCYDNAPMESFFKSYKTEAVQEICYETHEQATRDATDFIERFYKPTRLHSALEYQSPAQFEAQAN